MVISSRVESFISAVELLKDQGGVQLDDLLKNPEKSQRQMKFAFSTVSDVTEFYSPDRAISQKDLIDLFGLNVDRNTKKGAVEEALKALGNKIKFTADTFYKQNPTAHQLHAVSSGLVNMQDSFKKALAEFFSWFEKIFTDLAEKFLDSNVRYDFTNTSNSGFRSWVSETIGETGSQVLKIFCYFLDWLSMNKETEPDYLKSLLDKVAFGKTKVVDIMRSFYPELRF